MRPERVNSPYTVLPLQGDSVMEDYNDKVASLHQCLEEARLASAKGDVSPEHYRQVDEAINQALRELPITNSDDGPSPL